MIISLQVDGRLLALLDREAEARGISRSEAARRGMELWTSEAMEEDEERVARQEARHRQVMNQLDFLVGMIRQQEKDQREERKDKGRTNGGSRAGERDGGQGDAGSNTEVTEMPMVPEGPSEREEEKKPSRLDEILARGEGRRE